VSNKILQLIESASDVPSDDDDLRPPEFSDESLALRFAELHKNDLRYVAPWGRWLDWDGMRWRPDITLRISAMVSGDFTRW
jgi:putative DNA primase/helicase